jgi:hypothetical protein
MYGIIASPSITLDIISTSESCIYSNSVRNFVIFSFLRPGSIKYKISLVKSLETCAYHKIINWILFSDNLSFIWLNQLKWAKVEKKKFCPRAK